MVTCATFLLFAADSLGRSERNFNFDLTTILTNIHRTIPSLDLHRSGRRYVLHRFLCPLQPSGERCPNPGRRIFCIGLHFPLRSVLPIRMGSGLLVRKRIAPTLSTPILTDFRIIVSEIPTARLRAMNVALAAGTFLQSHTHSCNF